MIHQAFRKPAFLANGTTYNLPDMVRVHIDGGLRYKVNGREYSAWEGGYDGPNGPKDWKTRWQAWDPTRLDRFSDSITAPYFALNVEHYGLNGLSRLVDIIEHIRRRRPDVAIGVWSLLPKSLFWPVYDYSQWLDYKAGRPHLQQTDKWWAIVGPDREVAFRAWQAENDFAARKLVPHVDYLMPSCYPVIEPTQELMWTAAREPELSIAECRRVAPHLPVIASYYAYISSAQRVASPLLTKTILDAMRAADHRVIWGDQNTPQAVVADAVAAQTAQSTSES
jgi:hypothetical protein